MMERPPVGDRHIAQIRSSGRMAWQAATGYNQRSRIETQIGRWKSVIGPRLQCCSFSRQITEIQLGHEDEAPLQKTDHYQIPPGVVLGHRTG